MNTTLTPNTIETTTEPTDALLRSLLDSELILIGGGESSAIYGG
jgi:peptidase E